jgi:hypothetical protein
MCLNRNYKGIKILVDLYPCDFAIECFLNPKIKPMMRANFAKLLNSLHIDKSPLEQINVPVMTRVWHDTVQRLTNIQCSRVQIPNNLKKLKSFVVNYFEDLHGVLRSYNKELNCLTLQILIITEKMVNLGFL